MLKAKAFGFSLKEQKN